MRIFVTGGTGFNGKFVVQKLDNGTNKILTLTRNEKDMIQSKNISYIKGDLGSVKNWKDSLKNFKPQATVHLAWEGIPDYGIETSIKNLNYGLKLITLLGKLGCQTILVTGTIWEYGNQRGKLTEDFCTKPFNSLTAAKNSLHYLGREIANDYNMNFIWTRLSNSYGPGRHETSLIPYLIKSVQGNKAIKIRDPNAKNDFIYVEDVAEAISQLLLKCRRSDVFNIGSGKLISINEIIEKIFKILHAKKVYKVIGKKQIDSFSGAYADISKIKNEVGWEPKVNLDEGLQKTAESIL